MGGGGDEGGYHSFRSMGSLQRDESLRESGVGDANTSANEALNASNRTDVIRKPNMSWDGYRDPGGAAQVIWFLSVLYPRKARIKPLGGYYRHPFFRPVNNDFLWRSNLSRQGRGWIVVAWVWDSSIPASGPHRPN